MPLALSTGHEIGLGVTALVFILFALASSFLFPRYRPDYPGRGLLAFIVIAFVFFFGMLTAVEVFGAESKHHGEAVAAETTTAQQTTTRPAVAPPNRSERRSRMNAWTSWACSGVAVRPVPIAHTGS